ncbi:hypothetical protein [Klebsiella spallanzanii]|nr:hypothetical protein [Klebsiella spallanzanii]
MTYLPGLQKRRAVARVRRLRRDPGTTSYLPSLYVLFQRLREWGHRRM